METVSDITIDDFVENYVVKGVPVVFRHFIDPVAISPDQVVKLADATSEKGNNYGDFQDGEECTVDSFMQLINNTEIDCEVYGCYKKKNGSAHRQVRCSNSFLSQLIRHPDLLVQPHMRMWKHKRGNYTHAHYDANMINVFNFSLKGSKTFYLSPPNSRWVFPLTGIGVQSHMSGNSVFEITITPGDLLYIPATWFHSVLTNEDSVNVNITFFHRRTYELLNARDNSVVYINRALNSSFHKINKFEFDQIYRQTRWKETVVTASREIGLLTVLIAWYAAYAPLDKKHNSLRILLGIAIPMVTLLNRSKHGGIADVHAYILFSSTLTGTLFRLTFMQRLR